ncbi:MAG: transcriptional regulator, HxlR family [Sporomusa sp.]|jgi:DNA-binding HxlR family transcriptional regulator|nr:transcriptional regulator, HxlR family [Sporomusa sp.]
MGYNIGKSGVCECLSVRYSGTLRHLPSISKKILTEQLRELERDGIIERKSYPEPRPRLEYMLTSLGRSMIVFLDKMSEWGEEHILTNKPEFSSLDCNKRSNREYLN